MMRDPPQAGAPTKMNSGDQKENAINQLHDYHAEIAIVLGSGLNSLVADAKTGQIVPYARVSGIPQTSVPGHVGRFVLGEVGRTPVIFAQGRVHLYEGFSARDVTAVVRVLAQAGIKQLIVTNAAGAVNPKFAPGEWMMITDQINLSGTSPLVRRDRRARRTARRAVPTFVDLTEAYSSRLREKFRRAARKIDMVLHEGVYACVLGPQYDTPAEVRMLQGLGADAIGMSTVLEVIQARALGLEVAGFSCLTNLAAGLSATTLSHGEVLQIGKAGAASFSQLLEAFFGDA